MKFTSTISNLEILFWTKAIRLMKARKLGRVALLMFLIGGSLVAGMLLSVACTGHLYAPGSALRINPTAPAKSANMPIGQAANGQRNLLLVQVDQLQSENAQLRAVWLMVILPSKSHVNFLPLYPASLSGGAVQDERLKTLFQLENTGAPSPAFLNSLSKMDLWWDHYLVLDEIAFANLIELVGGVNLGQWPVNGVPAIDNLSPAFQETRDAMVLQAVQAQEICIHIPRVLEDPEWKLQFDLFADHISSDMDLEHLQVNWPRLREYGRSLVCEFPTLPEVSATEPAD